MVRKGTSLFSTCLLLNLKMSFFISTVVLSASLPGNISPSSADQLQLCVLLGGQLLEDDVHQFCWKLVELLKKRIGLTENLQFYISDPLFFFSIFAEYCILWSDANCFVLKACVSFVFNVISMSAQMDFAYEMTAAKTWLDYKKFIEKAAGRHEGNRDDWKVKLGLDRHFSFAIRDTVIGQS